MADEPKVTFVEQIPSVVNGNSAIASANAPIVFIDECPTSGYYNGIAHITCEAIRWHPNRTTGKVDIDRMTVAHLRMNLAGLVALKDAIARAELIMAEVGVEFPPKREKQVT
jgi:hypothetical protein